MLHTLDLIFWWSIGAAGVLLIYASLSYETEDGRIQSLLELWWIKVDDYKKSRYRGTWHLSRCLRQSQQRYLTDCLEPAF